MRHPTPNTHLEGLIIFSPFRAFVRLTFKTLVLLFFLSFLNPSNTMAQTPIDNSYFSTHLPTYQWDMAGSPYLIMDDIQIPDGSDLIIEPDVEVLISKSF